MTTGSHGGPFEAPRRSLLLFLTAISLLCLSDLCEGRRLAEHRPLTASWGAPTLQTRIAEMPPAAAVAFGTPSMCTYTFLRYSADGCSPSRPSKQPNKYLSKLNSQGVPKIFSGNPAARSGQWVNLYDSQLSERVLFLFGELTREATESFIANLLHLDDSRDKNGHMHQPVYLHLHSTGGPLTNALAIFDLMQLLSSPVYPINCGLCASSASLILAGGAPGHRYALGGSRVLLHLPMGSLGGHVSEIQKEAEGVQRITQHIHRLYGDVTRLPSSSVASLLQQEKILTAEEARDAGIVDTVIPLLQGARGPQGSPPLEGAHKAISRDKATKSQSLLQPSSTLHL